ncbi:unnamed protein product [Mytilus coruscus]|uniref:Uncharacterized protein n=1 Tax=Mytilus coruscus TaxID=42192 RepID=A0A6J8AS51_MYTCO|nr:unnamed protein product [Mytilus coruscus]
MKDNMLLQENLNTVVSGVDALSILSKIVQGKTGEPSLEKDEVVMETVLKHLSAALLSSQKNNLDTPSHATKKQTQTDFIRNNINLTECVSTDGNDYDTSLPMSTDSEPCDSDDQSEPEIDYEKELLSRMLYYGQYENSEAAAHPADKLNSIPVSSSTPLASSTMMKDCSESTLRNNRRRKNRSTPLASSTMMEDLIADIQQQNQETGSANPGSIVTWSIDNSTNTASLKEYYNRYYGVDSNDSYSDSDTTGMSTRLSSKFNFSFSSDDDSEVTSSDFWNRNGHLPRTSTSVNLNEMTNNPSPLKNCKKKTTKSKQPVSKLLIFIRGIKKNITRRTSSKDNSRR